MEGQFGILVGGRTELALFTAINSLPLTAYRFLLSESLAPCSSAFPDSPRRLARAAFVSPLRFRCCGYSKQSQCFLSQARTSPQERGSRLAEAALSRKRWGIDAVHSPVRQSRCSYTRACTHRLNLTSRFARGNLKCKTETRADAPIAQVGRRVGFSVVATSPCAMLSAAVSVRRVNTF